ncbi:stage V sporulation protein AB [Sporosalibacterium faouarense]|uniref:stage V sporulation protein AB n=1 Tax=Sporosalibacterium faouarense TaxID=516123 RepID=UPI00141D278B|nr:stage V sporulation protein AB [Sporosalibacterium faouarense]MTI49181.1 stage V sporulation protein AC [Bacillota bacterium]
MLRYLFLVIFGLSGGALVGTASAAFITLLDIIPRLAQVTNSQHLIRLYERVIVTSGVIITFFHLLGISINLNKYLIIPIGFIMGAFVGLLASALAEVINVIPVLVRTLKIRSYVYYALLAISLGKMIGSLIDWLVLANYN